MPPFYLLSAGAVLSAELCFLYMLNLSLVFESIDLALCEVSL